MFNDLAADGQAQAHALRAVGRVAALVKAVEHQQGLGGVDARPVVLH